jgi:hypothetical protein
VLGILCLYPPFPASCPFKSALTHSEDSPLTDPAVQNYRSGFLKRDSPRSPKRA